MSMAFDPVQSLFAVGSENGFIRVFGQHNVDVEFALAKPTPIEYLRIVKSAYLVAVDAARTITVFNMDTREEVSSHVLYSNVSAVASDPAMDWLFVGLENGQIVVYDIDRGIMSNFRIDNLQKSLMEKLRLSPVIHIAIHPRDPSLILVCYTETAIVFNIIKQEIVFGLRYEVPAGAPGGDTDPMVIGQYRYPPLLKALWHPNGHHILTAHFDGSIVFWDATEGHLLHARTLIDTDVNIPRKTNTPTSGEYSIISDISWNCTQNPEDISILVAGGHRFEGAVPGLTMLDFGVTPSIAMTSYQAMGDFYRNPKRQRIFPIPDNTEVVDFIMIPRDNPYYAGCYNPHAVIAFLNTGEFTSITYPDGLPVTTIGSFPSAFSWIQPYVTTITATPVPRIQLLGMLGAVAPIEPFFIGGAPARRHLRKFDLRNALCNGHLDGTIRIWDASHGELETAKVFEISVSETLRRHTNLAIKKISFSGALTSIASVLENGDVIVYKFGNGKKLDPSRFIENLDLSDQVPQLQDIRSRTNLQKDGFLPMFLLNNIYLSEVTCMVNSDLGFLAIGYRNGNVVVVDQRGPAIIYSDSISNLTVKKSAFKKKTVGSSEYPTALEFGIYALGDDKYSSIVFSVGSSGGNVFAFRVLPSNGGFGVHFDSSMAATTGPVNKLIPINLVNGTPAIGRVQEMEQLAQGILIHGGLIIVSTTEVRIVKQPKHKLSHRTDIEPIATSGVSFLREKDTLVLTCISRSGNLHYFGLPSLKEIYVQKLPFWTNPEYIGESIILPNGDIIVRQDKITAALINIWGKGIQQSDIPSDILYDAMKIMPPRPTISTIQWLKGRPVATVDDVDELLGGPRRPPSKFMIEQEQAQNEQRRLVEEKTKRQARTNSYNKNNYGGGIMNSISSTLDNLEESTNQYFNTLNETVKDGQNSMLKSALKNKFF